MEDVDRLLVASSAVIPIFGFPEWKYYNLRDVWLYADAFLPWLRLMADNIAAIKEKHPALYELMTHIFHQSPPSSKAEH